MLVNFALPNRCTLPSWRLTSGRLLGPEARTLGAKGIFLEAKQPVGSFTGDLNYRKEDTMEEKEGIGTKERPAPEKVPEQTSEKVPLDTGNFSGGEINQLGLRNSEEKGQEVDEDKFSEIIF
jgi:hypothetical protein